MLNFLHLVIKVNQHPKFCNLFAKIFPKPQFLTFYIQSVFCLIFLTLSLIKTLWQISRHLLPYSALHAIAKSIHIDNQI